jgi:hypothetical protein
MGAPIYFPLAAESSPDPKVMHNFNTYRNYFSKLRFVGSVQ